MKIRIAGLVKESITDGRGIRYTIFTQGCPHGCKGCHNPDSHDPCGGYIADTDDMLREIKADPLLKGVTFSGGEPFIQPVPLTELARKVHGIGKDVTVYSGWTYEELCTMNSPEVQALLDESDVLVDGRYDEALRNLELSFRGSENQRLIDLNATRENGRISFLIHNS